MSDHTWSLILVAGGLGLVVAAAIGMGLVLWSGRARAELPEGDSSEVGS
jgi:hypothetical protein